MLDGADNARFGTIKTNLKNNMTYGLDSDPNTKVKTVEILNN